jgi:hypothetical protein
MKRRILFVILFSFATIGALPDSPGRADSSSRYGMDDLLRFGVQFSTAAIFVNYMAKAAFARLDGKELTLAEAMRVSLPLGISAGFLGCVERITGEAFGRIAKKVPDGFSWVGQMTSRLFNRLRGQKDPLSVSELQIWKQTFESMMANVCEQTATGNLMLKNVRVADDAQTKEVAVATEQWAFLVTFVDQVCTHIKHYLVLHGARYKTSKQPKSRLWAACTESVSTENRESILFVITILIQNLDHTVSLCKKAETLDDLDVVHMKKIARTTVLLFQKLQVLLGDDQSAMGIAGLQAGVSDTKGSSF